MKKPTKLILIVILVTGAILLFKTYHRVAMTGAKPGSKNSAVEGLAINKKRLLGQFDPASERGFVKAKAPYGSRDGLYVLRDVYEAFIDMHRAAKADGVSLVVISATRNFEDQKRIWQGKWSGERLVGGKDLAQTQPDPVARARVILRYSSMPGTSRHHWGTDIDINSVNNEYFDSGQGRRVYAWLSAHAAQFGFVQVYTPKGKDRPHGYEAEPWHWSYNPIAKIYTRQYRTKIGYDDIAGFKGAETASRLEVIKAYVLGINRDCLQ